MSLIRSARSFGISLICGAALLGASAPAAAQDDPNPGAVTLTGGIDFLNAYLLPWHPAG